MPFALAVIAMQGFVTRTANQEDWRYCRPAARTITAARRHDRVDHPTG
jgi:hypothetical protein